MRNILFILTDDQLLATLEHMPKVKRLLGDRGMTFSRAYAMKSASGAAYREAEEA